jgi:AraC-like DNA-binding protein
MPTGQATLTPPAKILGASNTVLAARAKRHFVKDFPGPLSIKHVVRGRVAWRIEGRDVWVDDSSFLVLNDGEPYSMAIDGEETQETFCVFFERGFVERLRLAMTTADIRLLDEPEGAPPPLTFLSRLHPLDPRMMSRIHSLRNCAATGASAAGMEEYFLAAAEQLLLLYQETRAQVARVPVARPSTREELSRRMARGLEYLHAEQNRSVTLAEAARAACLSPFHFHRVFRQVMGQTPQAYLAALRLDRAQRLLRAGMPVTEVCAAVGFASLGSFSTSFRKRFGAPPSGYRPQIRKIREA